MIPMLFHQLKNCNIVSLALAAGMSCVWLSENKHTSVHLTFKAKNLDLRIEHRSANPRFCATSRRNHHFCATSMHGLRWPSDFRDRSYHSQPPFTKPKPNAILLCPLSVASCVNAAATV
eukprot:3084405-Amphidinium_carterae.1